jgi:hypothetical protein
MRISDINRGSASAVQFEANGEETLAFKADTLGHDTVDIIEYEIVGLHVQDIKELEVGELEGRNLDILRQYLEVESLPSDDPGESVVSYELTGVPGVAATIAYAHSNNPGARAVAVPARVIETRSVAA